MAKSGFDRFGQEVNLGQAKHNDVCQVIRVDGDDLSSTRLLDLGFTPDTLVRVHNVAPFGKTILVELRGYTLALRRNAASIIRVKVLRNERLEKAVKHG